MAETPAVLTGSRGGFSKIHLYEKEPEDNGHGGMVTTTFCGLRGFASRVDLEQDPRDLCSRCVWARTS